MVAVFRSSAVETFIPAFAGLIECLLHDVPESPEKARCGKAGEHHHQKFVSKRAGHAFLIKQVSCRADELLRLLPKAQLPRAQDVNAEQEVRHRVHQHARAQAARPIGDEIVEGARQDGGRIVWE